MTTDKNGKTILVMGATGKQGGASASALLADGWRVRALVRDTASATARALASAGVEVVPGDMDVPASVEAAAAGAYGIFSVQPTVGSTGTAPGFTVQDEMRWGITVADVAAAAGVRHLVFSSVGGADRDSGVDTLNSKWVIEEHIRGLGIPATVLRPATFMENFASPRMIRGGALQSALEPDTPWQLIAVADVGLFVAMAFDRPEDFVGRSLDLAGDELTPAQIAAAIAEATECEVGYATIPIDAIRAVSEDAARAFTWLRTVGYQADIPALRTLYPDLMTFRAWLASGIRSTFEALLQPQPA